MVKASISAPKTAALSHKAVVNVSVDADVALLMSDLQKDQKSVSWQTKMNGVKRTLRGRSKGWGGERKREGCSMTRDTRNTL